MRSSNETFGFWLGGNDGKLEGSWVWTDGTPGTTSSSTLYYIISFTQFFFTNLQYINFSVEFTDWQRGQPNNVNGNQDCMV